MVQVFDFKSVLPALVFVALVPVRAMALYSPVIINEVDYDQAGTDDGGEFIELKNVSDKTVDLGEYTIELMDGANPPAVMYISMDFSSSKPQIEPGGYFVICASADISTLTDEVCNRFAYVNTIKIQNDRRDGIRLLKGTEVVDSLSWGEYLEGLTEGTNPAPEDWDTKENYSISRVPDGLDTDQNDFDFKWTCASPHRANYTAFECLCLNTSCTGGKVCNPESGVCEVVVVPEDIIEDTGASDDGGSDVLVPDTAADNGVGEDAAQPSDTASADVSVPDTAPRDTARPDTGPGLDAAHWLDLPVQVDDIDGEDDYDKGCTAGRSPGNAVAIMIVLFAGIACLIGRRRHPSV